MHYVISDIHGCYEQYKQLLNKIAFNENDILYVLGDVVDRGPHPIKVLQDIINRSNVVFLLGNHDYLMMDVMKKILNSMKYNNELSDEDKTEYFMWLRNGGYVTEEDFLQLDEAEQNKIFHYIENASVYEECCCGNKKFLLVHAGFGNYKLEKPLGDYELFDLIESRVDYSKRYFEDTYLVTGHTPTPCITGNRNFEVYEANGHIAIDCGCVFGGRLAAYCLETGVAIYVDGMQMEV